VSAVLALIVPAAAALAAAFGARTSDPGAEGMTDRIDRLLPQTQCGQCGYAGCRPYAEAMARGEADVDRCPPGGDAGARALAKLLRVAPKPYDRTRGEHKPPQVALIVEADCIGCTKCIQACPVDAIVGASKLMHTVIDPLCTGCELCVPVCPVDCIVMERIA
jgi:electron transport complex protein RnfB